MPAVLQRSLGILFIAWVLFSSGCYSSPPLVAIHTQNPSRSISVIFPHAYFATSPTGEDQIVLLREPIDESPDDDPSKPLVRQNSPALYQVLQIQLHWRTAPAGSSDSPVANNAVVHWYVYGDPDDAGMGLIHYVGSGAVTFSPDGLSAHVTLDNAQLTLADQHGPLLDPFKNFQINARFKAVSDPAQLKQTLDDLNKAMQQASAPTSRP